MAIRLDLSDDELDQLPPAVREGILRLVRQREAARPSPEAEPFRVLKQVTEEELAKQASELYDLSDNLLHDPGVVFDPKRTTLR